MKKLMLILVRFANWFVSLFVSKRVMEPIIKAKETLEEKFKIENEKDSKRDWGGFGKRRLSEPPPHNNRKNTRGRHIQHIDIGNNKTKVIFHAAK